MQPLFGEHERLLDTKRRIRVPAALRIALGDDVDEPLFLAKQPEGCVGIWPSRIYLKRARELGSSEDPEVRRQARLLFGSAFRDQLDAEGRLTIPVRLVAHAGLEEDVVLVGVGDHIELWNREAWDEQQA